MAKINTRDRNKNIPGRKPNWEYRFEAASVNGRRKSVSKSGFATKKEALQAGAKAMSEYNNAGMLFRPSEISLSDYFDLWMKQYCEINLKYKTQQSYQFIIDKHLRPALGGYKLCSITPAVIQSYINDVSKNGYSTSYVHSMLSVLVSAFNYAIFPLEYVRDNPVVHIRFPSNTRPKRERIVLSTEDFERLMVKFPFGNRYHIPLLLGVECGFRISETCGLTWDDIDFEARTINVDKQVVKRYSTTTGKQEWFFTSPKYDSRRVIRMGQNVYAELKAEKERQEKNKWLYRELYATYGTVQQEDEKGETITGFASGVDAEAVNLLCVDENGHFTSPSCLAYASRVIRFKLGITYDFHALRHTHATILIESGVTPKIVQQRLGHRNVATTLQTYVHVTDAMQDEALQKFEEVLGSTSHSVGLGVHECFERGQSVDNRTGA